MEIETFDELERARDKARRDIKDGGELTREMARLDDAFYGSGVSPRMAQMDTRERWTTEED